jgi:hypothetical protein
LRLLAGERYMSFLIAKATTGLATFLILTTELLVNFHWETFHFEVAEWTFRQEVKTSSSQFLLLL